MDRLSFWEIIECSRQKSRERGIKLSNSLPWRRNCGFCHRMNSSISLIFLAIA